MTGDELNALISTNVQKLMEMRGWRGSDLIRRVESLGLSGGPTPGSFSELLAQANPNGPKRSRRWNTTVIANVAAALGVSPYVLTMEQGDELVASAAGMSEWSRKAAHLVDRYGWTGAIQRMVALTLEYHRAHPGEDTPAPPA